MRRGRLPASLAPTVLFGVGRGFWVLLLVLQGCAAPASTANAGPPRLLGDGSASDFELEKLDGGRVRLAEHFGKDVVLVDFWATYCEPCLVALPHLDELYRKYQARGFVVLAVSIDEASAVGRVRTEVAKLGLTFPILLDPETRVVARYNPKSSAPYSVLIGRNARVLRRQEGYSHGDQASLEQAIVAALD